MRILASLFCLFLLHFPLGAQVLKPVKWSFSTQQVSSNVFDLNIRADIDKKWALYSQYLESDEGPLSTEITFNESADFELIDKTTESNNLKEVYDPVFAMDLKKFFDYAVFTQRVKLTADKATVTGDVYFMCCDDTRCLAPEYVDFSFDLAIVNPEDDQKEERSQGNGTGIQEENGHEEKRVGEQINEENVRKPAVDAIDNVSEIAVNRKELADELMDDVFGDVVGVPDQSAGNILSPVTWSFELKETDEEDLYEVTFFAEIDEGWYIYTQHIDTSKIGPTPTTFVFEESEAFALVGTATETALKEEEGMDPYFDMVLKKLKGKAEFTQKIKVLDMSQPIEGWLMYMTCNASVCIPGEDIEFSLDPAKPGLYTTTVGPVSHEVPADYVGIDQRIPSIMATYLDPVGDCGIQEKAEKDQSMWFTFVLGFLGGLLALLTPCVFPMIPLTVSYFSKDSKRKGWWNGSIYGLSIIGIYVALGLIVTATFGTAALNALSTNWIANSIFFLIFVAFALSFFGYYEITLPSSWANRSDSMADKGGLIGIFFMAATLAIVSFSCTGPIIGSAIVQSATNKLGPFVVMLGFSTALALPFGLFAAFPAWLNSLPRSGSWMNSVKVILGFLELALALKFLSVADMTSHWGVLRYEVFLGAWVIIAIGMALYLFGVIRFPHDSPIKRLSLPRLTLGIGLSGLALYLMTGFLYNEKTKTYNSLPMLSGLAPPAHYNFFIPPQDVDPSIKERFPSFTKCANNLDCFKNYSEGVAYAKEVKKPVFLDFTGYGCVNCRKTEEHIWIRDRIWEKLRNDFVLVSLYVDDRKELDTLLYSIPRGEKLRNVGRKWADFQILNFEQNTQPLYVIMSTEEEVLTSPRGYSESVEGYNQFLECGLKTFERESGLLGSKE